LGQKHPAVLRLGTRGPMDTHLLDLLSLIVLSDDHIQLRQVGKNLTTRKDGS